MSLSLFAYVATVFIVDVPWGHLAQAILLPSLTFDTGSLTAITAVLGTTISPYLFFWQAEEEVEDEQESGAGPLTSNVASFELERIRLDTYLGMGFSNLIALFIIVTTAATLNANGITDIQTSSQAAEALRPIAGKFAFEVFALGIIGTGLLALPVLAGSAAYALGEAFKWRVGLGQLANRAPAFYLTIAIATAIGVGLNFVSIDPIKALFWSAVLNAVVAVPVMVVMMLMAARRDIMGRFVLPKALQAMGWLATAVMALTVVTMIATWIV
jgi:Mn2+/Fe2+ NRAMP family transporter